MAAPPAFGLAPATLQALRQTLAAQPGIERVWIFGSRARGDARENSDVDLAVDAPGWTSADMAHLLQRLERAPTLLKLDVVHWQAVDNPVFRTEIMRDRREFWAPVRLAAHVAAVGGVSLKPFQQQVLQRLGRYLDELLRARLRADELSALLQAREDLKDSLNDALDYPRNAWDALRKAGALPAAHAGREHQSRHDGAGHPVPNVCLKVPTGGGKTLLAAASVGQILQRWQGRSSGLVLWIVPNEAIYRQTLKALSDRDHPYRQLLNVAAAGRVKVLEKTSPLTQQDVQANLCVMVLMLQSAARASKETLRLFRDRGNVLGFVPREDDIDAHWALLQQTPNLDVYKPWDGLSDEEARAQKGAIVKSSLGNAMRLLRPLVVIDEGHHAYSETALKTLDGFNPSFMLELSATPRVAGAAGQGRSGSGSNVLCDVRGTDLDDAEMIKLPIQLEVGLWAHWQGCLAAALAQLDALQREAETLQGDTGRYIRPILLVQAERTGADTRDSGFIHADDVRDHLLQLGLPERAIAIKTSERNDLAAPENIDLMSPTCEVRVIITKQALQEGWDCPFAYVLCSLAAGRNVPAMTQLVGRILRLPHAAKTGREALDACYALCHDAQTGQVVAAVKKALEGEGLGDLAVTVRDSHGQDSTVKAVAMRRRAPWQGVRLFVPQVTWVNEDGSRRPLVYESDVLAAVPWADLDVQALAAEWAPDTQPAAAGRLAVGLELLASDETAAVAHVAGDAAEAVDAARLVRALGDLAPNPWWLWQWVQAVLQRLRVQGLAEHAVARSMGSLSERLRLDLEAECNRLSEQVFRSLLAEGRIEFRLRADPADYELPQTSTWSGTAVPGPMQREADGLTMQKSLLEPALRTPDLNDFELKVAGYLDQQAAVRWWHRNVARGQAGLQGWRRHKVYPDFVFAMNVDGDGERVVLLETKGAHLDGSDTAYKQALLHTLAAAFRDERWHKVGSLALESEGAVSLDCDLVFDDGWRGTLAARFFSTSSAKG
jgi:type III restriction enzyme